MYFYFFKILIAGNSLAFLVLFCVFTEPEYYKLLQVYVYFSYFLIALYGLIGYFLNEKN